MQRNILLHLNHENTKTTRTPILWQIRRVDNETYSIDWEWDETNKAQNYFNGKFVSATVGPIGSRKDKAT